MTSPEQESKKSKRKSRKEQILQSLAAILEESPGGKITTASLAKQVGVSEAALYRHFPSKTKMFDELIEFAELTIFTRLNMISSEQISASSKCEKISKLVLTFAEKNPGISRILAGDALWGENERLRFRVNQLFDRIEVQIKQILREDRYTNDNNVTTHPNISADIFMSFIEGKIAQFVRSDFSKSPTEDFDLKWKSFAQNILA
ncbi:MAG: nucleoid occlusion factor SlmA [Gammaproteobacteria bacterium TMED180]|nr:MAG: nucleoid occlusion factor SlmA [Gammaproteobacteria bacterium TMED180]OUW42865.1 MAG: nucleoid occlusion factor SlmA [Gammaproteobacteria bacterium TMED180]|tara:strand:+ start:3972 stop:4583 length:612 start_codon:yes stop_codon:yes gene_type:complete